MTDPAPRNPGPRRPRGEPAERKPKLGLPLIILLVVLFAVVGQFWKDAQWQEKPFTEVTQLIRDGKVRKATITQKTRVRVELDPEAEGQAPKRYSAAISEESERDLRQLLEAKGIQYDYDDGSADYFSHFLVYWLLPLAVVGGLLWFVMRRMGPPQGVMNFGKSRAKIYAEKEVHVTFEDVAGADEAVEEVREIVEFLREPKKFQALGARIPKGVLLLGAPGTGKTLLARAVAGEAAVPFFSLSGSDFVEMFVGVGASVTGDTPVLIRTEERTELVPIAEFVDRCYEGAAEGFVVPVFGVQTLGYERREVGFRGDLHGFGGSAWKSVGGVFRHRVDEVYEIEYVGGTIRTTGDHSVFVRRHGGIEAKAARDLRPGDVLVDLPFEVRGEFDPARGSVHEVRAHEFDAAPPARVVLRELHADAERDDEFALAGAGVLPRREIGARAGVSKATVGTWQSGQHEPRAISTRVPTTRVAEAVPLTSALMKLFGYHTAEGRANDVVDFCFGSHEREPIADCAALMRDCFGLEAAVEEADSSRTHLLYRSATLGRFFERHCGTGGGTGAHEKHVPELLWTLPRECFLAYLEGWCRSDGHVTPDGKLSMTSVSKRLARELAWLCAMHGMKSGVGHGTQRGGWVTRSKPVSAGEHGRHVLGRTGNPFAPSPGTRRHEKAVVRRVERRPYDGYVYDLCGCENEAFFGGENPVLLHNSRVRDLFRQAEGQAPCLVFIDELDALGKTRGASPISNDEREQTLNALLVEMDGFDPNSGVIIIAATNRPEILDPALLRPGRFDRQIVVDRPDVVGRRKILEVHARKVKLAEGVDLALIAKRTPGFVGADLANVINEAALLAARRDKTAVTMGELEEAIDRVMTGLEKQRRGMTPREKEIVATHETGHAIVGYFSPGTDPVHRISIIPRGVSTGGHTLFLPEEERSLFTRDELIARITALLGGRAAERVVYGHLSTGAANDLEIATRIARHMVTRYGMSEVLGPVSLEEEASPFLRDPLARRERQFSEGTQRHVDEEVRDLTARCEKRAIEVLTRHREKLDRIRQILIEKEVLEREEFERLMSDHRQPEAVPAAAS